MCEISKNFKKGDIIVVTSERSSISMGIATGYGTTKFERDISFDEAAEKTLQKMQWDFPKMFKDWTIEQMKQTLNSEDKYFLTIDNDVCTYYNHEIADSFDLLYIDGGIELFILTRLKDKYVREFNIKSFKFPGDKWSHFRIYDDISNWVNKNLNNI